MKILAVDLDQTLLRSDKSISSFTKEVFHKLKQTTDHKVIIATGRSVMRAEAYMKAVEASGIISLNGAKTMADGEVVSEYGVEEDQAVRLVRKLLSLPDTFVNVTYPDVILTNNKALVTGDHVHEYTDYETIDTKEIAKVSLVTEHPELVRSLDLDEFHCKLVDNSKDPKYFAILNKKVSKLTGLTDICHQLGLSMDDVIAFGDDYNDLDILTHAGHAVVVANAVEAIKALTDDICLSNDEDGVADWVNRRLL